MAKKPNLLSEILAQPPIARGPLTWFGKMPEGDIKQQLRELHAAWRAGKLAGYSALHLHGRVKELAGVTVGTNGFECWLKRENPDG